MGKKFYFFVGTEAELIKIMPVMKEFKDRGLDFKIIASGQNVIKGSEMLKFLNIEKVDLCLYDKKIKASALSLFWWFLKTLIKAPFALRKEFAGLDKSNTFLIVHGDTVTTVMGAIVGKFYGLKIVHLEAGYRSFNFFRPFPEEIDRVLTSYFADIHFCPYEKNLENLKNRKGQKINTFYNSVIDSLHLAIAADSSGGVFSKLQGKKYFILILHRQENLYNDKLVKSLVKFVFDFFPDNLYCLFVMHAPTRFVLEKLELLEDISKKENIITVDRLPYMQFIKLFKQSEFIMTDGGSNQQEAYYLGKPCLILREIVEVDSEGVGENMVLSELSLDKIKDFILNYNQYKRPIIYPNIKPSKIIVDTLLSY
ncbi:MAG: UDP-N-acetylglucosamine 2-epimerase [Patescibacteria group bacterium]|nr:UDP-N-acetylglucosamine 2-epimerase [Patescibacteria group bacterium]MDD5491023.1 UDP-N-acetylglucosamine 2-epimerase [Patescibacteria group bacterium]